LTILQLFVFAGDDLREHPPVSTFEGKTMKVRDFIPGLLRKSGSVDRRFAEMRRELHDAQLLTARLLIQNIRNQGILPKLADAEFRVFSQFGDDGIIQYLLHHVKPKNHTFVEFGVEKYTEANTRFLLVNDNWRGLILDGCESAMQSVRKDLIYWRHDLTAVGAFIDRDNINDLISKNGFAGQLGLLSIDIDGNDYWVWERINCVEPEIVVAEYNSVFGFERAVTVPYDATFVRNSAHHSNLYWGCSLRALITLANRKGYAFVGCNSNGNNCYFVRRELLGQLPELTAEEGFVDSQFRESRDRDGRLTFVGGAARRKLIADMPLVDVETDQAVTVRELAA